MVGAVEATTGAWLALELGLMLRDRARSMGGTARDRGTRNLNFVAILAAVLGADAAAYALDPHAWLRLPGWRHPAARPIGLAVLWMGLALRVWAVAALGRSFRTTVEVDVGQAVVDRGPYRLIRHPSYTGILLLCVGVGLADGNWISFAIMVGVPLAALLHRIAVEEGELIRVLGQPYRAYAARTKRLIPYVW